jgi:hypothetical protein
MAGVACRNLHKFNTNIKAGHEFEQRQLEANFGQSKFFEPCLWWRKMDVAFFLPNFFKNLPNFEFVSKSYGRFTKPPPS